MKQIPTLADMSADIHQRQFYSGPFELRYNKPLGRNRILESTKSMIRFSLVLGEPSRASIAKSLGLSVRTLQRRLVDHQTTFADMVNAVRKEQAQEYIRQNLYSLDEIAFLLGYSNVRSFFRAFKKWFACTPGELRKALISAENDD